MKKLNLFALPLFFLFISVLSAISQQVSDTAYEFAIYQAAYQKGDGPVIFIDEAHNNFHTRDGGFFRTRQHNWINRCI
jgi:replication-associated recombination protein RarA